MQDQKQGSIDRNNLSQSQPTTSGSRTKQMVTRKSSNYPPTQMQASTTLQSHARAGSSSQFSKSGTLKSQGKVGDTNKLYQSIDAQNLVNFYN